MNTKENTVNVEDIKKRSFLGVFALTSRTFALQLIAFAGLFLLGALLKPATFGIFAVVTSAVNFLNYFSDIGLAAALVQSKSEPTQTDYDTAFLIQQFLVGTAVVVAIFLSFVVPGFSRFGTQGIFLFRSLAIAFLLSSLKTIPSVQLERKLNFNKLVIPQVLETGAFYIVAVVLAWKGFEVASFAWAALARGFLGTIALYIIAPWMPTFQFSIKSVKHLLKFGLPFQANSFLALIKDDLLILYLGYVLSFDAVGFVSWAKKWAEIALRLIMDNIIRVTFPAFARLQHDKELLTRAIHKSFVFLSLLALPIAVFMMLLIKPFIEIVPRYGKWEPALFSFYLFTISSVLAALSSPLVNALNALGKVKYTFLLMTMWTMLTWLLMPIFVSKFGFNGVALAAVVIGLTSFVPLVFLRKVVAINIVPQIIKPLLATSLMAAGMTVMVLAAPTPLLKMVFGAGIGIAIYGGLIYALMANELKPYVRMLLKK